MKCIINSKIFFSVCNAIHKIKIHKKFLKAPWTAGVSFGISTLQRKRPQNSGCEACQARHSSRRMCSTFGIQGLILGKSTNVLPALLQKLVGDFFYFSQGNLGNLVGILAGILRDFFLTHRIKAQKFRGKFRGISK